MAANAKLNDLSAIMRFTPEVPCDESAGSASQSETEISQLTESESIRQALDRNMALITRVKEQVEDESFLNTIYFSWNHCIAEISPPDAKPEEARFKRVLVRKLIKCKMPGTKFLKNLDRFPPVHPPKGYSSPVLGGCALLSLCLAMNEHSGEQALLIDRVARRTIDICGEEGKDFVAQLQKNIAAKCDEDSTPDFGCNVLSGKLGIRPGRLFRAVLETIKYSSPEDDQDQRREYVEAIHFREVVLKIWKTFRLAKKPPEQSDLFVNGKTYIELT